MGYVAVQEGYTTAFVGHIFVGYVCGHLIVVDLAAVDGNEGIGTGRIYTTAGEFGTVAGNIGVGEQATQLVTACSTEGHVGRTYTAGQDTEATAPLFGGVLRDGTATYGGAHIGIIGRNVHTAAVDIGVVAVDGAVTHGKVALVDTDASAVASQGLVAADNTVDDGNRTAFQVHSTAVGVGITAGNNTTGHLKGRIGGTRDIYGSAAS